VALATSTAAAFAALGAHIAGGGAYEARTLGAMTLRLAFWTAAAALAFAVDVHQRTPGRA
jgi:hypothetical protein